MKTFLPARTLISLLVPTQPSRGKHAPQARRLGSFVAVRADEPDEPIPPPPSHRDKWRLVAPIGAATWNQFGQRGYPNRRGDLCTAIEF